MKLPALPKKPTEFIGSSLDDLSDFPDPVKRVVGHADHTTVTASSSNIFADLGLPDSDDLLFKAQIVAIIDASIRSRQLTQAAAAERMGIKQPDVSKLLKGRYEGFSLERLFHFLMMLGHELKLEVADAPANDDYEPGHLRLAHCV